MRGGGEKERRGKAGRLHYLLQCSIVTTRDRIEGLLRCPGQRELVEL